MGARGYPEVFVIAGCGAGYARSDPQAAERGEIPFAAGILWENDLDYPSAMALAEETISTAPFEPIRRRLFYGPKNG